MSHIRTATLADLDRISELESLGFPPAEAASKERLQARLSTFPECFWLYEEDRKILGYVAGGCFNTDILTDEMYADVSFHEPKGRWQMLYSVCTHPDYRHQGIASKIMKQVESDCRMRGREGIILTCKENLIPFYEKLGYQKEFLSSSSHGGATWYQMRLLFK